MKISWRKPAPIVEQKSLAQPTATDLAVFTGLFGDEKTFSVGNVLEVPAVAAGVKTISESTATLELNLVRRDDNSASVDHAALDLLRDHVNSWTSGFELIRDLVAEALIYDQGGIAWVNKVGGRPSEIIHYVPGAIQVTRDPATREPSFKSNGQTFPASDIINIRDGLGRAPLNLARQAIDTAAAIERHVNKTFANGAKVGGILKSKKKLGEEGAMAMAAGFTTAYSGPNASGRVAILWDDTEFIPMTMNSVDAQTLELQRFLIEQIARALNMSPVMLGDLTKSSYANAWQKNREFLGITLMPWLRTLESEFNRVLLTDEERAEFTFQFDVDDLSRVDLQQRATAISSLISARVLSANEARNWLDAGLPPYEGGDQFANPNTGASQPDTKQKEMTDG